MPNTQFSAARWAVLTLAGLAGLGTATTQAQVKLRWKFTKGEPLVYIVNQKTSVKMHVNNRDIDTTMTQVIATTWTPTKVEPDGTTEMTQVIDRIRMKMESAGGGFEFDSKSGTNPAGPIGQVLGPVLRALAGARFTLKMSPLGEVSDVKVPEQLIAKFRTAGPAANAGGMLSESGLKNLITQATLILPKQAIGPGDTWTRTIKIPTPPLGTMVLDNTYTFEGPASQAGGHQVEKIDLKNHISIRPSRGAQLTVEIKSQEARGGFSFDNAAGHLVKSNLVQNIQLGLTIQNMELIQDIQTTVTMKLGGHDETEARGER